MAHCLKDQIAADCPCTYTSCAKRGKCCECVVYHRKSGQFPACFFSAETERTYDRSYAALQRDRAR